MLSEEEKQAIDFMKYLVNDYKRQFELLNKSNCENYGYSEEEIDVIKFRNKQFQIVLNIIEKQSKEIEGLKNADLTTVYINGFYDGKKKVKDKIKAKIKEIEKEYKKLTDYKVISKSIDEALIKMLQSLLEKE